MHADNRQTTQLKLCEESYETKNFKPTTVSDREIHKFPDTHYT